MFTRPFIAAEATRLNSVVFALAEAVIRGFFMERRMSKKSFVLYLDQLTLIEKLSDSQVALLFRAILSFLQSQPLPKMDLPTELVFIPIKNQLERDTEKYNKVLINRIKAGKKGGLAKASKTKQELASASTCQNLLRDTVTDTDTDTDTVNVTDTDTKENIKRKNLPGLFNQDELQEEFDKCMANYPPLAQGWSKIATYQAWLTEYLNSATFQELTSGVVRYCQYIIETNQSNTKFVIQPKNFFKNQDYKREWRIPDEPTDTKFNPAKQISADLQQQFEPSES